VGGRGWRSVGGRRVRGGGHIACSVTGSCSQRSEESRSRGVMWPGGHVRGHVAGGSRAKQEAGRSRSLGLARDHVVGGARSLGVT